MFSKTDPKENTVTLYSGSDPTLSAWLSMNILLV